VPITIAQFARSLRFLQEGFLDCAFDHPASNAQFIKQVSARLQSFLRSPNEVMKGLSVPEDRPEVTLQILIGAKKLAAELSTVSPTTAQDFVRKAVRRVVVQADKLDLEVSRSKLRARIAVNKSD
jgi:hypothetical protein